MVPPLDGIERVEELVYAMNFQRVERSDRSIRRFLTALQRQFRTWQQNRRLRVAIPVVVMPLSGGLVPSLRQSRRVPSGSWITSSIKRLIVFIDIDHDRCSNSPPVRPKLMTATGKLLPNTFTHTVVDSQRTRLSECLRTVRIRIERIFVMGGGKARGCDSSFR